MHDILGKIRSLVEACQYPPWSEPGANQVTGVVAHFRMTPHIAYDQNQRETQSPGAMWANDVMKTNQVGSGCCASNPSGIIIETVNRHYQVNEVEALTARTKLGKRT